METILAEQSVGISELKANPNGVIEAAEGRPIALLNRNKPVAYLLSPELYEAMLDRLEDYELSEIARERLAEPGESIKVDLNEYL
jgi:antitoxin StbD